MIFLKYDGEWHVLKSKLTDLLIASVLCNNTRMFPLKQLLIYVFWTETSEQKLNIGDFWNLFLYYTVCMYIKISPESYYHTPYD